jgi:hypothetical protein
MVPDMQRLLLTGLFALSIAPTRLPADDQLSREQVAPISGETGWWSLQPLVRPPVPDVDLTVFDGNPESRAEPTKFSIRNPIDAFVLARLRENGLSPSHDADGRTLVRRLYFDLTGLSPSLDELERFGKSSDPRAYDNLVEHLLASPRYGERWARHWLDVVHYGDTHGYDKDKLRPNAWPYRDYVIRAFNDDTPYGRFVQEQVAGDVLYPDQLQLIAATGFIVAGPWDYIGHVEVPASKRDGRIARYLDRDDMVTNTIQTFTSMTVQCARCHDHKFDPITQQDYFSLQAVFAAIGRNDRPYDIDAPTAKQRLALAKSKFELEEQERGIQNAIRDSVADQLATVDAQIQSLREQGDADQELADAQQLRQQLLDDATTVEQTAQLKELGTQLADVTKKLDALPESTQSVFAAATDFVRWHNHKPSEGKLVPIHVLRRGEMDQHGELVGPGTLSVLAELPARFALPEGHAEGECRIALALWLADRRNALTWRSIVNRIWLYHFGRGIVNSPNDFGHMGQEPTHPDMLDWLACEFRDGGQWISSPQSIKQLHKLIVTSSVYRQSVSHNDDFARIDSGNAWLWRANRRRLEAEAIRDTVLSVAGKLDLSMYGPGFRDFVMERAAHSPQFIYEKHDPDDPTTHRRSVYRFLPRSQPQPFMEVLDCADPSQQVARRDETVTPLSALALLNNRFMVRMAEHFAARLEQHSDERDAQIELAFRLAISRSPTDDERAALVEHSTDFGLPSVCRVIFNLSEFVFVD